ncbi:dual oxidase maturation factor 1 mol isoform X2 [Arctopsyche grandis]
MRGWFDAFRSDGGPTLYSFNNRTPVTGDVSIITLYVVFATLYFAFLVIFPGIRKERFTTFSTVTLSLFVGTVILVARHGSGWHVATTTVESSYRAFSTEKVFARVGAYIGLDHVNVTLLAIPRYNYTPPPDVEFNERFNWLEPGGMAASYGAALRRGLPFPILTVAEYLSLGQEGFAWGGQYRAAGYYAGILLWVSFASWLLMNLLVVVVPRYGGYLMVGTGCWLLASALGYWALLPACPLSVQLEGGRLLFTLGWCFWLVIVAGCGCLLAGIIISAVDWMYPHRFSTVIEVDYDTPYDRHVIIEESHDTRFKKRGSKDDHSLGSRILRRLSSKTRDMTTTTTTMTTSVNETNKPNRGGIDNRGYQMDAPKSPWRFAFRKQPFVPPPYERNDSTSSIASSIAPTPPKISPLAMELQGFKKDTPPVHKELTRTT